MPDQEFNKDDVREITVLELKRLQDMQADIVLIDVREPDELEVVSLGAKNIPLGAIDQRADEIPRDKPVIVHCKSGRRSMMAILFLQQQYGFENLRNLGGGILAYAKEIDTSLPLY